MSLTFTVSSVVSTEFEENDNTEVGSAKEARAEAAIHILDSSSLNDFLTTLTTIRDGAPGQPPRPYS